MLEAGKIDDYWFERLGKRLDICAGKECCADCRVIKKCRAYRDNHIAKLSALRKLTKKHYDHFRDRLSEITSQK